MAGVGMLHLGLSLTLAAGLSSCTVGSGNSVSATRVGTGAAATTTSSISFNVDSSIQAPSVAGYIVGHQSDLKITTLSPGLFGIANVPADTYDVIVMATSTDGPVALRIPSLNVVAGQQIFLGTLQLPAAATVRGNATLADKPSQGGVTITIPGTDFTALAGQDGAFAMTNVPVGTETLNFSASGYDAQTITVTFGVGQSRTMTIALIPVGGLPTSTSTGSGTATATATGTATATASGLLPDPVIAVNGGAATSFSQTVNVAITAPAGVTKVRMGETSIITNAWQPVASTLQYTFDSDGSKELYVQVENDGIRPALVSPVATADITINSATPGAGVVKTPDGTNLTNVLTPTLAISYAGSAKMRFALSQADLANATWLTYAATENQIQLGPADGVFQVWFQFQDIGGNSTPPAFSPITLVRTGPAITALAVNTTNPSYSKSANVPLTVTPDPTALSPPTKLLYSCDGTSFKSMLYSATPLISITDAAAGCATTDGARTITVELQNQFNVTGPASTVNVQLITTPPTAPTLTNPPGFVSNGFTNVGYVNYSPVTITGVTAIGTTAFPVTVSITGGFASATTTLTGNTGDFSLSVPLVPNTANPLVITANDVAGNASTLGFPVYHNNVAPTISGVAKTLTSDSATIQFTTSTPTNSVVKYGPTTAYAGGTSTETTGAYTTSHSVAIPDLPEDTLYHYQIVTTDQNGNATTQPDDTFTTYIDTSSVHNGAETWDRIDTPYYVSGNVYINSGSTITVKPGVTIAMAPNTRVKVFGTFIARGTPSSRITITSIKGFPAPGDWDQFDFPAGCAGPAVLSAANDVTGGSVFEYVDIKYGGATTATIQGYSDPNSSVVCGLAFLNSSLTLSKTAGIIWDAGDKPGSTAALVVRGGDIANNGGDGIDLIATGTGAGAGAPSYAALQANYEVTDTVFDHNNGWGIVSENPASTKFVRDVFTNNTGGGLLVGDWRSTVANDIFAFTPAGSVAQGMQFADQDAQLTDPSATYAVNQCQFLYFNRLTDPVFQDNNQTFAIQSILMTNSLVFGNTASTTGQGLMEVQYGTPNVNPPPAYTGTTLTMGNASDPTVGVNMFNNASTYYLSSTIPDTDPSAIQTAANNYWGVAAGPSADLGIEALINDYTANHTHAAVDFNQPGGSNYLTQPNLNAPLSPPPTLAATSPAAGQATLTWSQPRETDVVGYNIAYGSQSGPPYANKINGVVGIGTTSYTLSGLTSGTKYYFAVTAVKGAASTIALPGGVTLGSSTFSAAAHGFVGGQAVQVAVAGGTLPSPLAAGTTYFIDYVDANDFKLAATSGGAAITLTAAGSGTLTVYPSLWSPPASVALPANVTVGTSTFHAPAHGLAGGQSGRLIVSSGGTLPSPLAASTTYYVIVVDADDFQLAAASGGSAVTLADGGTGTMTFLPAPLTGAPTSTNWTQPAFIYLPGALNVGTTSFYAPAHGYPNGQGGQVSISSGGSLPNGLATGTTYYATVVDANDLQISSTPGGSPLAVNSSGSGTMTFTPAPFASGTQTYTSADVAGSTFNVASHGLADRQRGYFSVATNNFLPPGLVAGTDYYVAYVDADDFQIAAAEGGIPLALGQSATVEDVDTAAGVLTAPNHGFDNGTRLQFTTTNTLPGNISVATDYYVINRTDNTFQFAATRGGAAIVPSSAGTGTLTAVPQKVAGEQAGGGDATFTFTPDQPSIATYDYQTLGLESWFSPEASVTVQ